MLSSKKGGMHKQQKKLNKSQSKLNKSQCAKFIEEARNGKYASYNSCYEKCIETPPAKDASLYCGNGSECDAFCDDVSLC